MNAIDWSRLPAPADDGAAAHLTGLSLPAVTLPSTAGGEVALDGLGGGIVLYAYPMTAGADGAVPEGWDLIPGARGCTPQSCAFRDHAAELRDLGVDAVFGVSTQARAAQVEAAERLHLPFALLSDERLALTHALRLPTFEAGGRTLLKRLTLIVEAGVVRKVFYPVFPPDRNATDVVAWLRERAARRGE